MICLQVHLSSNHLIIFNPMEPLHQVLEHGECEVSMLTGYFAANQTFASALHYTYQEFPQHFVWHICEKQWHPHNTRFAIGHLYFVAPNCRQMLLYLHLLLTTIKGPTSWQDLRTFNGIEHPSFYAACLAWGLL